MFCLDFMVDADKVGQFNLSKLTVIVIVHIMRNSIQKIEHFCTAYFRS